MPCLGGESNEPELVELANTSLDPISAFLASARKKGLEILITFRILEESLASQGKAEVSEDSQAVPGPSSSGVRSVALRSSSLGRSLSLDRSQAVAGSSLLQSSESLWSQGSQGSQRSQASGSVSWGCSSGMSQGSLVSQQLRSALASRRSQGVSQFDSSSSGSDLQR